MSNLTPEFVSQFVSDQFPEYYREDNGAIVEFVLAYYEWLEQTNQTTKLIRSLQKNRDIDDTIDAFVVHFKKMFFSDSKLESQADSRFILKHISDLYQAKGSIRSVELLIRMLYGEEVDIFLPSKRIVKASDAKWIRPTYIELTDSIRNPGLVGKFITGSTSGATAFVESVITKVVAQKRITIAYLSNVLGVFVTGEYVTNDGVVENAPKITGSLSSINITNGGRNFTVGDIFNVISTTGKNAKAKVTEVLDATGKVDFTLANGGYGYTISNTYTQSLSSNATIQIENLTNANTEIEGFFYFENVYQPLANVAYLSSGSNTDFLTLANNAVVYGANVYANGDINNSNVASGYVVSNSLNAFSVIVHTGDFSAADTVYVGNTATNVQIDTVANTTAYGEYIGQRYHSNGTYTIGINSNNKPFYTNTAGVFIYGAVSNTYANVYNVGQGIGADFEIGTLGETETLTLFTDLLGSNNTSVAAGVPFTSVVLNGSNSQIGFVDSISIDTKVTYDTLANTVTPFAANGGFANNQVVFKANVFVNSVALIAPGTAYTNSDTVVFTGGDPGTAATATLVTHTNGSINYVTWSQGAGYKSQPAITITTSTGSGANLIARMGASGLGAEANVKSVNSTAFVLSHLSNGSFTAGDTITNKGVNAFANVTTVSLLSGTGYVGSDTVTFSGGGANVTATGVFAANAANSGSVHAITIDEPGTEYDTVPTITINTSTGSGASLTVNMDFGYGLPKSTSADLTTVLYDALTFSNFTIGEIAYLSGINPGSNYNLDPIALAYNPYVAGFNRRDIVCVVDSYNGVFQSGERLNQTVTLPGFLVNHSNTTSNGITLNANSDAIQIGEGVRQRTSNATGVVLSSNATHIQIGSPVGTFDDSYVIDTLSTGAEVTPLTSGVSQVTTSAIATGRFKSIAADPAASRHLVSIRRLSFGQSFVPGSVLTGAVSGATANVQYAYNDGSTLPIGMNAVITANVITANGVASTLEVIDSGYGYEHNASVQLESANTPYIVSGNAVVTRMGVGPGFWQSATSNPSDTVKIHDNNYYQEYSYVVRTGISLDKYRDILRDILHVAGTRMFGEVVKVRDFEALNIGVSTYQANSEAHPEGVRIQSQNAYSSWMG